VERDNINPFCLLEDIIPSRFALGFDDAKMDMFFMALDPERVGLENIENGTMCDFGDNVLEYATNRGRTVESESEGEGDEAASDGGMMSDERSDDDDDFADDVASDLLSNDFMKFLQS
jgi:hypothetical protein